jgi:hypothetical protein
VKRIKSMKDLDKLADKADIQVRARAGKITSTPGGKETAGVVVGGTSMVLIPDTPPHKKARGRTVAGGGTVAVKIEGDNSVVVDGGTYQGSALAKLDFDYMLWGGSQKTQLAGVHASDWASCVSKHCVSV